MRLKLEICQVTGSFKVRGATAAIAALPAGTKVITASAGNHGLGLAHACMSASVPGRIFVPATADPKKLVELRKYEPTIEVVAVDGSYDDTEREARHEARRDEHTAFISSYNDRRVIAGQATVAMEIFEDWPEVDAIVAPVGGGGLLSGIALVANAFPNPVTLIGVEPESSPAVSRSLAAGAVTLIPEGTTSVAEGLVGNLDADSVTFDLLRNAGPRLITVPDTAIIDAVVCLYRSAGLVAEPSGAAALLGVAAATAAGARRIACVITGSNIDAGAHLEILTDRWSR